MARVRIGGESEGEKSNTIVAARWDAPYGRPMARVRIGGESEVCTGVQEGSSRTVGLQSRRKAGESVLWPRSQQSVPAAQQSTQEP